MSSLASLVVDLQVNTAQLKSGLDEANKRLEDFGQKLDKVGKVVTLQALGGVLKQAVSGLTNFVLAGAQADDQTGKLAQSAGVSTEAFSRLQYAAKLSGLSGEELAGVMGKLSVNLAAAGTGAAQQASLFQALGVKVKDSAGHMRGTEAVLGDLADRFAALKDGPAKTALAIDVFGKSGAQLMPFLNEGRDGLAQLSDECDRLGITINDKAAQGAERFNDNLDKLHLVVQSVAAKVAANLAPSLANLSEQLLNSKDSSAAMKDAVTGLSAVLRGLVTIGLAVKGVFQAVGTVLGYVAQVAMDPMSDTADNFAGLKDDLVKISRDTKNEIKGIWSEDTGAGDALKKQHDTAKETADHIVEAAARGKKALEDQITSIKSLEKTLAELQAKSESFGAGPLEEFEARLRTGDLSQLLAKAGSKADELREKLRAAFGELDVKRLNEVLDKADFQKSQTKVSLGHDVSDRRLAANSVGENEVGKASLATAGFASFDDALRVLAKETMAQAEAIATAELQNAQGLHDAARQAEASAAQHGRAAQNAGRAADGFQRVAELTYEISQLVAQTALEVKRTLRGVTQETVNRKDAYDHVGETPRDKATRATGGFDSMDAALAELTNQTVKHTADLGQAEKLRAQGDFDGARDAMLAADRSAAAAEKAGKAADGFQTIAEIDFADAKAHIERVLNGIGAAASQLLGKMGDLGTVVNAGIQGFQSGGIWGAIIAVVIELLSRIEGWSSILDIGNGLVKTALSDLSSGLTSIIKGLRPLLGAIGMIFKSIHGVLNPILEVIGGILEGLAPIFAILGLVLKPLGSLFKSIGSVLGTVLAPILKIIAYIFMGVGEVMLAFQLSTAAVQLALTTMADEIFKAFGSHAFEKARNDANQSLKDTIQQMDDLGHMDPDKLMDLANNSADAAEGLGKTGDAADAAAKGISKLTEAFTNLPAGWRTSLTSYQSMDPVTGAFGSLAGAGGGPNITINVNGSLVHENQLLELIQRYQSRQRFRRYGTPVPP